MCFAYAQEIIILDAHLTEISFEDTVEYKYVFIDTDSVWYIAKPQKEILSRPSNLGDYAIITDTNQYYRKNCWSSIQFRLYLDEVDFYLIQFYQQYDFEPNKDGGIIETSYDNGETWQNVIIDTLIMNNILAYNLYDSTDSVKIFENQPGFTGRLQTGGYFLLSWQENDMIGDTMLVRFTFASDSVDTENEGWLLDDFRFGGGLVPIDDLTELSDITVSPNPAINYITIKSRNASLVQVAIISATGVLLYSNKFNRGELIDISYLQPGIYFIRCKDISGNIRMLKLIKS